MAEFRLSIVTPEEIVFDEQIVSLIVPAAEGYLGVLAHHAPLISVLEPGKMTIRLPDDSELLLAISSGFIEVAHNRAIILADTAEQADRIDQERALKSLERARDRIAKAHTERSWDLGRATSSFHRAENRVRIADSILVSET